MAAGPGVALTAAGRFEKFQQSRENPSPAIPYIRPVTH